MGVQERKARKFLWHKNSFGLGTLLDQQILPAEFYGLITPDSIHAKDRMSILGIPRISPARDKFYSEALAELESEYKKYEIPLVKSDLPLVEYLGTEELDELWLPHPKASEELDELDLLRERYPEIRFQTLKPNTLIQPGELPFSIGSMPRTFSAFRRKVEKKPFTSYGFSDLAMPRRQTQAIRRLSYYLFETDSIAKYKQTRNGLGDGDYSSRLSKYLAVDQLSAAEIGTAVLHYEVERTKNESTYWLIFELLWRDFFQYLSWNIEAELFHPSGFKKRRSPGLEDALSWSYKRNPQSTSTAPEVEELWIRFRSWVLARTGSEFIDSIMLELHATGESSNRARQNAASYLIHDLHVPWWWGALWFEHCLLDYDPASNWGNWAYIAGVGADALDVRKFNIEKQAASYDPDSAYRTWVAKQPWSIDEDVIPQRAPAGVYP
jgi:deoxyribodipyrimidine photo-lyase